MSDRHPYTRYTYPAPGQSKRLPTDPDDARRYLTAARASGKRHGVAYTRSGNRITAEKVKRKRVA